MTTTAYRVSSGDLPLASDVDQFVDLLNGANDVGSIVLAPQLQPPNVSVVLNVAAGTTLGIGLYSYQLTWVTGYKKTNNSIVYGTETTGSNAFSITTTSGNQAVTLSGLPTTWPSTAVALRIYRTVVGGTAYKLVTTLTSPQSSYTDTVSDASLGASIPTQNLTGTTIAGINALAHGPSLTALLHFESDVTTTRGLRGTFTRSSSAVNPSTFVTVPNNSPRFVPGKFGNAIFIEEGTTNLVSNPDFETVNTTAQVFNDALTSYTGSTVPAPWTLSTGTSVSFSASGVTLNSTAILTAGNSAWKPLLGSDGTTKLAQVVQATFTEPATVPTNNQGNLYLWLNSTNLYCAKLQSNKFMLTKTVNGTDTTLSSVAYTPTASTSYCVTLSLDNTGALTAKLYQGTDTTGTLLQTLTATDTSLTGGFLIGVGGDTGVIISNAKVTAPWVANWTIGGDSRVAWAVTKNAIAGAYSVCAVGVSGSVSGWAYTSSVISMSASAYTLSGYLMTTNVGSNGAFITSATSPTLKTQVISGTTQAQRYSSTQTLTSSQSHTVLLQLSDSGTVTFDDIQLEQKSYATSFVNGTRNAETLTLPSSVLSASAGTIAGWFYEDGNNRWKFLFDTTAGSGRFLLQRNTSNQYYLYVNNNNVLTIPASAAGVHHYAVKWDGVKVYVYIDGVMVGSVTGVLNLSTVTTLYIGCSNANLSQWNNWIDDFAIWNRALSDSEIYSIYAATQPIIDAHATPIVPDVHSYSQYASNPDNYDIYQTVQQKRRDGTLFMQSTLSNPDASGNYQTLTVNYYDTTGTIVVNTQTWTLSYDSYSRIVSKVLN